jgi:hypothetical protein
MYDDEILIRGAKEHNLKSIDFRLPLPTSMPGSRSSPLKD